MRRRQMDLYIGIFLIVLMVLSLSGLLKFIGITGRFIEVVLIAVGIYLIVMGIKK